MHVVGRQVTSANREVARAAVVARTAKPFKDVANNHFWVVGADSKSPSDILACEVRTVVETSLSQISIEHFSNSKGKQEGRISVFYFSQMVRGFNVIAYKNHFFREFLSSSVAKISCT